MKLKIEQMQRERRKQMEEAGESHKPFWFRKPSQEGESEGDSSASGDKNEWEFTHEYWDKRKSGDLAKASLIELW